MSLQIQQPTLMALSNFDRVGRSLDTLRQGLWPFVNQEFTAAWGESWPQTLLQKMPPDVAQRAVRNNNFDIAQMLNSLFIHWNEVFGKTLGQSERSLVAELRDVRNKWAHQTPFSGDDTYRALDSIERLLRAVAAPEASVVEGEKQTLLRQKFEEQARSQARKVAANPVEGAPSAGLSPWREVITPHPDVASGRFQQAEFAADLNSVHRGRALPEYGDPHAFWTRTYLTEGLAALLVGAVRRLTNTGGDPVVQLRTNFGGGKTHSMLALYHLVSGTPAHEMPGVEAVLQGASIERLPSVNRAVLVGTALAPAQTRLKDDGTLVHTIWGEIAHQLLGPRGYELLAASDKAGVSPGKELIEEVLRAASPCLILIDEWVAVLRQLKGKTDLPAGSFEANISFAQSLTEAAKAVPGALVVVSLPESDIELGGENGREALAQLSNVAERVTSGWKTATTEEGFEIVRRRLFEPMSADKYPLRDAVIKKYVEMYAGQSAEFPAECKEANYERRMRAAYPFHPELFDRLYGDWCSLEKFQRTRGVLRLMAAAIYALWRDGDKGLLLMPGHMPLGEGQITAELTRYLDDPWLPVIEKDVDGEAALSRALDGANPNLGRYSACRRVARTLFMGSAPTLHAANKGLNDRQVRLGCVQPGEIVATFSDALRRLTDNATHLYVDGQRAWFSTQPSVNRLAQDRAAQGKSDEVHAEMVAWLRRETSSRGLFAGVHVAPSSSAEVPDERDVRLVILGPSAPHSMRGDKTPARETSAAILEKRGLAARRFRNALAFLAPDTARLAELEAAVRSFLAWQSIERESGKEGLNLDDFGKNQAATKKKAAEDAIRARIPETWVWLLAPQQNDPQGGSALEWSEFRLGGNEALAVRAAKKLQSEGALTDKLAGTILRRELDRIPLWREGFDGEKDCVSLRQLADDFAIYLYLPRLSASSVLLNAARDGASSLTWETEGFAYADGVDTDAKRFRGLQSGALVSPSLDGVLVKPDAARRQLEAEAALQREAQEKEAREKGLEPAIGTSTNTGRELPPVVAPSFPAPVRPRRFYGEVEVGALRAASEVDRLVKEVIQHLSSLDGASVKLSLQIEAEAPQGVPDNIQRTVSENCRVLKFKQQEFESE